MRPFLAFLVVLIGIVAAGVYLSAFIVRQTEQAIVLQFGKPKATITDPGLHWKIPFVETVDYFDKRILDLDSSPQEVIASDQKRLVVDSFARFRITDALEFYKTVRDENIARQRLGNILESALRGALGSATFQDVVRDKRETLMRRIRDQVNQETKGFGIEVVDVRIKRADLPEQNSEAIYRRMQTERQREAAEFRAEGAASANRIRATADREATVIKAEATKKAEQVRGEGDAERNRVFAEAFGRDPEFFAFYRSMQAYENSIKSGDTRLVISPNSEFFRYFNDVNGAAPSGSARSGGAATQPRQ
ncbi:MAG: protease modulator HflC [Hyphomicrobiaceae bacterium]|nr:protease modulator HflC [Hyphomicrobiaceae bacterium]